MISPDAWPLEESAVQSAARTRRPECYTILLCGRDDAGGGSDTTMLMRFDAGNSRIDLVSLPRDTLLHHEWYSNKLNYAYACGGTALLRGEVENLLGVPVDYCVSIDLAGFVSLIDSIGGVDFDVPADMDYDDPAQALHIHFTKGRRHLDGQEAMAVVRWRKNNDGSGYPDADLGRIATQQAFLRAVAAKAARLGSAPALARAVFTYVKTDLTAGNVVWLAEQALRIGTEGVRFHTLPGDGGACWRGESVYALDPDATLMLVNEALNPYTQPVDAGETDILTP
ncbi:MAG: LCP family protein [Oscillospiraceae bacterium]|nr:LCP family protein [Oscillospiraceae bacterium]